MRLRLLLSALIPLCLVTAVLLLSSLFAANENYQALHQQEDGLQGTTMKFALPQKTNRRLQHTNAVLQAPSSSRSATTTTSTSSFAEENYQTEMKNTPTDSFEEDKLPALSPIEKDNDTNVTTDSSDDDSSTGSLKSTASDSLTVAHNNCSHYGFQEDYSTAKQASTSKDYFADATGTTDNDTITATSQDHDLSFEDEVHKLVSGTSQKFVPTPSRDTVLSDALLAIKRFRVTLRNREARRNEKQKERSNDNSQDNDSQSSSNTSTTSDTSSTITEQELKGLKTNLKPPNKYLAVEKGSPELEAFLNDLESTIFDQIDAYDPTHHVNQISSDIQHIRRKLQDHKHLVIVPTDKTNSFLPMPIQDYIAQMKIHLSSHGKTVSHSYLQGVRTQAQYILSSLKNTLSKQEYGYLESSINSYGVPSPKLLIKDHKKKNQNGDYPTRLLVPATNFVLAFPNLGYQGIKNILDEAEVDCMTHTITHTLAWTGYS